MLIRKVVPENLDKQRIDYILKELGLVESRNQALALIISGKVFIDNEKVLKPGKIVRCNKTIELKKDKNHCSMVFVARQPATQRMQVIAKLQ